MIWRCIIKKKTIGGMVKTKAAENTVAKGVTNSPRNDANPTVASHFSDEVTNVDAKRKSFQPSKNTMTEAAAIDGAVNGIMI
jgi:hypothetical protein